MYAKACRCRLNGALFEYVSLTMLCTQNVRSSLSKVPCIVNSLIGENALYRARLDWEHLRWISNPRLVVLTHRQGGPTFKTWCREFVPESPDQTRLYWKDKEWWSSIDTTAFGLDSHNVDLSAYISDFSSFYLAEASRDGSYIGEILEHVKSYTKVVHV